MKLEEMVVVGIGEELEDRERRIDLTKTHYIHTKISQPIRKKKRIFCVKGGLVGWVSTLLTVDSHFLSRDT